MSEKHPAVYIPASKRNGTLYTGVSSDLARRVWEHKRDLVEGTRVTLDSRLRGNDALANQGERYAETGFPSSRE
jgi:predicted GIY-YIG superfamily endonuclease